MRDFPFSLLEIRVHPSKPFFVFTKKDDQGVWHVNVHAPPRQNKANAEIEKECKRVFNAHVKIIKGHSSSNKVLEVALARERLNQLLLEKRELL